MGEPIATVGDLAGICGHDGSNWEKILIDSSKRLVIAIAASQAVEVTAPGGDQIFNFESVVAELVEDDADNGSIIISSSAVPSGKVWILTNIAGRSVDGAVTTRTTFYVNHDGDDITIDQYFASMSQYEWFTWQGSICLDASDYVKIYLTGVTSGDTGQLTIMGYQMDAPG